MSDFLEKFISIVGKKIQRLGYSSPKSEVLRTLINTAYLATLRTEEGRFVRGSITFADPLHPEFDPPLRRRAQYPMFTSFDRPTRLSVEKLVKLSRAVDGWSGSIAVHGTSHSTIVVWGVLDQLVQHNVSLNRESEGGFDSPGTLRIVMDGVGALSAYHGNLLLAGIRQDQVVLTEQGVLHSRGLAKRLSPFLKPIAQQISIALGGSIPLAKNEQMLFEEWSTTVARICIGIRRAGTGGALLISPRPIARLLDISQRLSYSRLGHSAILKTLDSQYMTLCREESRAYYRKELIPTEIVRDKDRAETDSEDRKEELAGAIRIVTSLALVDGLVLLTPLLEVVGFGVKIRSRHSANRVYVGHDYARRSVHAKHVDLSRFGTRHISMLNYCQADRKAIGVVISQDGSVRLMMSLGSNLTLWDNLQLLQYESDLSGYARMVRNTRSRRKGIEGAGLERSLGYTDMPKTLGQLMRRTSKKKK